MTFHNKLLAKKSFFHLPVPYQAVYLSFAANWVSGRGVRNFQGILRTPSGRLSKLRQVLRTDAKEPTVAHRWEFPRANPLLDRPITHLQQFRHLMRRIDPPDVGGFGQDGGLFLAWWHATKISLAVGLFRSCLSRSTEAFCTLQLRLNIPQWINLRQCKS
jgi:hypothetical protein